MHTHKRFASGVNWKEHQDSLHLSFDQFGISVHRGLDYMNRGVADEDSQTGESWMDASIRLHLRTLASGRNDGDNDSGGIEPVRLPPNDIAENMPLIVAELVHTGDGRDADKIENEYALLSASSPPVEGINLNQEERIGENANPSTDVPNNEDNDSVGERIPEEPGEDGEDAGGEEGRGMDNMYFGNTQRRRGRYAGSYNRYNSSSAVSRFIVPRTSLPYTIEHNEMTLEWTVMFNTNQEALDDGDTEKVEDTNFTMTFQTLQEARSACAVFAPPRMHSFIDSPKCHICQKSFNKILRRPAHCKNCGVCVCSSCSINWPSSMLPLPFHKAKRKRNYRVCMACDWLSTVFRQALLSGDFEKAKALERSGNLNTRTPFAHVRGDVW